MTRAAQLGVGLVAAVLLVWLGFGWLSSEVRQLSRRLDALAETASVGSGETNLVRMAKAARLAGYFTEDITIDLGSPSTVIRGRDTLMAMAARTQVSPEGLRIELVDVQITVDAEGARAIASMTVQGSGIDFATGDQMIDAREIEMTLVKLDGEWLIQRVYAVSAIRRPGAPAPIRDRP